MSNKLNKYLTIIIGILFLSLLSGGILLIVKTVNNRPVEIQLQSSNTSSYNCEIYIDGAVANPGLYPVKDDDTIHDMIESAGLLVAPADMKIKLDIFTDTASETAQKISINRADTWLLEALPGIGHNKAQAIIEYREQNGPFKRVEELLNIGGIGTSTFEGIKDLITVE
jgi:competence protein ComEA